MAFFNHKGNDFKLVAFLIFRSRKRVTSALFQSAKEGNGSKFTPIRSGGKL